jgi:hypothetical protein
MVRTVVCEWVYESNLRPFLEAVSWLAGYGFDDLDWEAVTFGLQRADDWDSDQDWFDYELGAVAVRLRGVFVVYVEVDTPPELDRRSIEVVAMVMQNYHWTPTATVGPPIKHLPYCPACGQEVLRRILVEGRGGVFLICGECSSMWKAELTRSGRVTGWTDADISGFNLTAEKIFWIDAPEGE